MLDREINILGVVGLYDAIIWTRRYSRPGSFKMSFAFSGELNRLLQRGNLIYKTDEKEAGYITGKTLTLNRRGEEVIIIMGKMLSGYLGKRIIWKKMILNGSAEQIMRSMVDMQCIHCSDPKRKIPRLVLGELKGYPGQVSKQVSYENLQETLTDVAGQDELGYRIMLDIEKKRLVFDIYKGQDRTLGSSEPCVFSRDFNNIYTQEYAEDESSYKNVCLVGGSGEDTERILVEVGNASGLDRNEVFCNSASLTQGELTLAEYKNQLSQNGIEKLSNFYIVKSFNSKVAETSMEYEIGDYVTCYDESWGIFLNTQIKEIEKGMSRDERYTVCTFGDGVPTLMEKIKISQKG